MSERTQDDFTMIKGIGPATQAILRDELNIHTFAELASADAETLREQLKGKVVALDKVETWINEAGQFVHTSTAPNPWDTAATFVVEFEQNHDDSAYRTKAHYMQEDKNALWDGLEHDGVSRWMIDHIEALNPTDTAVHPQVSRTPDSVDAQAVTSTSNTPTQSHKRAMETGISFHQVKFFEASNPQLPASIVLAGREIPVTLASNQPFGLAVVFSTAETSTTIEAACYAYNAGNTFLLDSVRETLHGTLHQIMFRHKGIPAGDYRAQIVVSLSTDEGTTPGYLEVPRLRVR